MANKPKGKAKKVLKIKLVSTGLTAKGTKTGTFHTTIKTKRLISEGKKLKFRKYDPRAFNPETSKCGMYVDFEEGKIK